MQNKHVQYVERYESLSVSIDTMRSEYEMVKHHLLDVVSTDNRIVQKTLTLYKNNSYTDIINNLPYTKSIIEILKNHITFNYVLYRSLYPKSCYQMHTDKSHFHHIPIHTNDGCFFIFQDRIFRMPANGSVYTSNSSIPHTFMNAGSENRIHLTFEVI